MAETSLGQAAIAADAAKTAGNIAKAVTAKTSPVIENKPVSSTKDTAKPEEAVIDPNAGKEKYIVDGKDRWLTPEQAKAYVQKGLAFEPKISELGRLQQETSQFLQTLRDNPEKILLNPKFGVSPDQILQKIMGSTKVNDQIKEVVGQWYYNNVVAKEAMSPQEREHSEMKAKLAEYEDLTRKQQDDFQQRENDAKVQAALNQIKAQISEAMADAGVPLDSKIAPSLARRVAQVMQMGYQQGKTLTPKEAMAKVKAEVFEYQKAYYDMLDEDKLVEQIGTENAEKVRKYFLKQVKEKETVKGGRQNAPTPKRDVRKTMNSDEFRDYLDELKKGK